MTQITRYDGNVKPFADDAIGTERTIFGSETQNDTLDANINANFLRGWGIVSVDQLPTKQDFNGFAYTSTALTSYLFQMGVPEWNDEQEYFTGSITNKEGTLYTAVQANTDEDPATDDGSNWLPVGSDGFDISGLSVAGISDGDFLPFEDISDANKMKKVSWATLKGEVTTNGQQLCKAWVNFNGDTNAIRDSYNISSITDNGTGRYFPNFASAMPNANYVVNLSSGTTQNSDPQSALGTFSFPYTATTAGFQVLGIAGTVLRDMTTMMVSVFGD